MDAAEIAGKKKLVRELMAQDRQRMLMRAPFTGGVAMRLDLVPVHDCRLHTCATDGERIYADIEFYGSLNDAERRHMIAHEIWHCVYLHFLREQGRDHEKCNYVEDLEIYFMLEREGLGIPAHLAYMEDWKGKSMEEMYELLPQLDSGSSGYVPAEDSEHIQMKGADRQNGFDRHYAKDEKAERPAPSADLPEPYFDDDFRPGWRPNVAESIRGKAVAAAQQMERTCGSLPARLAGVVRNLLKPEIRWQELLAQFVTSCYGGSRQWLPPARRHVWQGLYLQSQRDQRLKAVVALDTSGSTAGDLPRFFSELTGLLTSFGGYELTVVQCDAAVADVETFDDMSPLDPDRTWTVKGGGGTDFRPVFEYVGKNVGDPNLLIFFTDGCGPAPERAPGYPVMWLLTSGGAPPCDWGTVVRFAPRELRVGS